MNEKNISLKNFKVQRVWFQRVKGIEFRISGTLSSNIQQVKYIEKNTMWIKRANGSLSQIVLHNHEDKWTYI